MKKNIKKRTDMMLTRRRDKRRDTKIKSQGLQHMMLTSPNPRQKTSHPSERRGKRETGGVDMKDVSIDRTVRAK